MGLPLWSRDHFFDYACGWCWVEPWKFCSKTQRKRIGRGLASDFMLLPTAT